MSNQQTLFKILEEEAEHNQKIVEELNSGDLKEAEIDEQKLLDRLQLELQI